MPGDPERTRINLVPRDFVIDALDALSTAKVAVGKTYHLADPDPPPGSLEAAADAIRGALRDLGADHVSD